MRSRVDRVRWLVLTVAFALLLSLPHLVTAATVVNPLCSGEDVTFNPGNGEDIVVPPGFKVSVFVKGLNAPTAVAFRGNAKKFEVFVLESGHGLPSICNDEEAFQTAHPSAPNPFNPDTGRVTPFITGLPTGDHPAEQITFKDDHVYWSQGSTTNSGVVGRDNGGGANQQDIPCQDIKLSDNVFDSGGGVKTSGYSPFGVQRKGATVRAFDSATGPGICDGAILRARLDAKHPKDTIEPFSWGYRNPYGIRFAPDDHPLRGGLFVTENGEDERGARPTENAPDRLHLARQNHDGSPDYHGWPDRFGFLDSTQAVFTPTAGPGDDLCTPPAMAVFNAAPCLVA